MRAASDCSAWPVYQVFSGETISAPFLFFRTLFAIGLIGLGLIL